jgi:glycosyltransferase involved in cell wall biosynthesis
VSYEQEDLDDNMRILQVIPFFLPSPNFGGSPVVCHNLSSNLVKLGSSVTVVTSDAYDRNHRLPNRISHSFPYNVIRFRNINNYLAFKYKFAIPLKSFFYFKKHLGDYDIVHLNEYRTILNLFACMLKPRGGVKYILHPQGTYANYGSYVLFKKIFDFLFRKIIDNKIDWYLAISDKERKDLIALGVKRSKVKVIYNGVGKITTKKPKFKMPDFFFLYLGQISQRKGVDCLVEAFAQGNFSHKGCQLLVVGRNDGYLDQVKRMAIKLKVSNAVIFHDSVSPAEGRYLLGKARLALYVAQNEAYGLVPIEAATVGTFCLTELDSGAAEVLVKYRISELTSFCNISGITKAMLKYSGRKIFVPMRKRMTILDDLSWERCAKELEDFYIAVISK